MNHEHHNVPAFGGEKSRRLYWACKKDGIVKVSGDGKLIWVWEKKPPTLNKDGFIFSAQDFLTKAATALHLKEEDVFSLEDDNIRNVARKISGLASLDAREAGADAQPE